MTKEESQQDFEKLLNRFQKSLHFEDLLNQIKEALSEINKDEKQQTKIDCYFKKLHLKSFLCIYFCKY